MKKKRIRIIGLVLAACIFYAILGAGCSLNQNELFEKAKSTRIIVEFQQCCNKIKDQKLIGDLVLGCNTWGKRRAALDYLTDQKVLSEIIAKTEDFDIGIYGKQRLEAINSGRSLSTVPKLIWVSHQIDSNNHFLPIGPKTTFDEAGGSISTTK